MGCCCSQSPILDDPTIVANFKVARFYAVRGYTSLKNDAPGLLYIDGQNLYYEATCGEKRACCLCCRFCQPLSTIKEVTIKDHVTITWLSCDQCLLYLIHILFIAGGVNSLSIDENLHERLAPVSTVTRLP